MLYTLTKLKKLQDKRRQEGCVICARSTSALQPVPEIDKTYYCYDDGKIRPSREYQVKVLSVTTYDNLPEDIKEMWQTNVIHCYWLFMTESDYFIHAEILDEEDEKWKYTWFARMYGGGWFSFSNPIWEGGELDVDGTLYKIAHGEE